jgi:putative polyhydroxyalkanoate system protein
VANLHILREHALGLAAARKIALVWAQKVEREFDMTCQYEKGQTGDTVTFVRTGVHGTLQVTKESFELDAKLGLLLGAFMSRIEAEIIRHLDQLLVAGQASERTSRGGKSAS